MSSVQTKAAKMKSPGASIISQLKSNRSALTSVVGWIVLKEYEKEFKKCKDCGEVGSASTYHGKLCRQCYRKLLRESYAKQHPELKRTRKVDDSD
jgi:hypothetical protein